MDTYEPQHKSSKERDMDEADKLAHIREFCNSVTERTAWDAYELACEVRDFIDGELVKLPI